MARSRTKDIDLGYTRILKQLTILGKKPYVKIGINEQEGAKRKEDRKGFASPFRVVDVAVVHEFGTRDGRIPQRSFVRSTSDKNRRKWFAITEKLKNQIFVGTMNVSRALDVMGVKGQGDMRRTIQRGIPPPLSGITLQRRRAASSAAQGRKTSETFAKKGIRAGKATPLIDTGQLVGSIQFVKVMNPASDL